MNDTAQRRLGKRLRRILLLLPYVIRNPGVTVGQLCERFGVAEGELLEDLDLVFVCGVPGYGPGDLIDVTVDGDRVYVAMADYFSAPLRLSPTEALSLYAGAAAIVGLPGMEQADALRRALGKLGRLLDAHGAARTGGARPLDVTLESAPTAHLEALQTALSEHRRVRLEYLSASRGELTRREVDPWGLIAALGWWYLVGLDHLSGEERMFRADRIKSVDVTELPARVPDDFDPGRYKRAFSGGGEQRVVTFEISPDAARWFADYYPVRASRVLDDGWHEVELTSSGDAWAATLALRLGRDVRAIRPESVHDRSVAMARSVARRYREAASS